MSFLTRAYGAAKLALKANSPTIMVVGGVVAMGAGAVLACKQTLKVEEVLAKHTPDLEKINRGLELKLDSYPEDVARADRFRVYSRAGLDLGRVYLVPTTLFVGGAVLVFGGHRIMLRRNATLAVAFTSLSRAFEAYRARVVERLGHDTDQAFYHGAVVKEVVDPETGEVATIATRDWDDSSHDPYNRVFDQASSSLWEPDLGVNKMLVHQQQRFANQRLAMQGYLYLNDVYEALGFAPSDLGQVVGWKIRRLPDGTKDIPFVDFGLDKPMPDDWKYTKDKAIYLDFNCQGLIVGGKLQKMLEQL